MAAQAVIDFRDVQALVASGYKQLDHVAIIALRLGDDPARARRWLAAVTERVPAIATPIPSTIATPQVMMPYVPEAARPTPTDVFSRPTLAQPEPIVPEERPTLVALVIPAVAPIAKASVVSRPPPLPPQARKGAAAALRHAPPPLPALPTEPMRAPQPTPVREEDIEASFTAIERTSNLPPRVGTLPTDMNEVRALFD